MKFLIVVASLLAVSKATPFEPGYGVPAAPPVAVVPVEQVTIPAPAPPLVQPAFLARTPVPFAPAPVRFLNQPPLVGAAPLPAVRRFAGSPLPLAPPVPLSPSPLAAAPFFPRAAPVPAPLPLAAGPAPLPFAAGPAPLPLVRSPIAALAPVPAPLSVPSSQFHAQDEFGGFNFGYQNVNSNRQEVRSPDGVTRGSYSYVDANGIPQTVNYIADPINGFRVQATNLPVGPGSDVPQVPIDTPEVRAAKAEFQAAFDAAVAQAQAEEVLEVVEESKPTLVLVEENGLARKKRSPIDAGYGIPAAPVVVPVPVAPVPAAPIVVSDPVVAVEGRRFLSTPIAPVLSPRHLLPARRVLPIGPAPVIPGPVRTIPAAAATVRTPLTAQVSPLVPNPLLAAAPLTPAVIPQVPVATPTSQFHAQDEAGGFSFGYQGPTSGRQETRTADGVTQGSYSYVDANGVVQTVNYVADALGFRVAATNLPVA